MLNMAKKPLVLVAFQQPQYVVSLPPRASKTIQFLIEIGEQFPHDAILP
jgi:hypothetical protein